MTPVALPWAPLAGALTRLYGLPGWSFKEFAFWALPGEATIYMAVAGSSHPDSREALLSTGWPILDAPLPDGRPTDALLGIVGADATRNVVEVDDTGAASFARGEALVIPPETDAAVLVVRRGKRVLGGVSRETGRPITCLC